MRAAPFADPPERIVERNTNGDPLEPMMEHMAARHGALFVSPRALLCDATGCRVRIGDQLVAFDEAHLTLAGSRFIAEHLPIDPP
jgi:hypothetical protein